MMRKMLRSLTLLMILAFIILPGAASAEGQAVHDAFTLSVDNVQVALASATATDVGLILQLSAGLNQARDRGLLAIALSGADKSVLNLFAALENGKNKGYLSNALGGLPWIVEVPVETLREIAGASLPMMTPAGNASQIPALLDAARGITEALSEPDRRAAMLLKMRSAFLGMTPVEETEIELFGEKNKAQVYVGTTNFAYLWSTLEDILASDPALKASLDEVAGILEENGALAPGVAFADLPGRLKEKGNDIQIEFTEFVAGREQSRLVVAMTPLEAGVEKGTITLTIDSDLSVSRPATVLTLATEIHEAASENLWISLESSRALGVAGDEGYFGLLVETGGESGGTVAFQIETKRTDVDDGKPSQDRANLSVALISKADASTYTASIQYDAENSEQNGLPTVNGGVTAEIFQNGASLMQMSFDLALQQGSLSNGELFTFDESFSLLDVGQITDEQTRQLSEAVNTLFNNTVGLLFQVPGMSAFLNSIS